MEATVGLSGDVATAPVCEALGLSRAGVYRRRNPPEPKAKKHRPSPARALSPTERQAMKKALAKVHQEMAGRIGQDVINAVYKATGFDPAKP